MYCTVCFPKGCPKCQPPAPAEEHEFMDDFSGCVKCGGFEEDPCEPPTKTVFKSVEVEKPCYCQTHGFAGDIAQHCCDNKITKKVLLEDIHALRAERDALLAEQSCSHCGTRDVGFFTCGKCETKEHEKYMKAYDDLRILRASANAKMITEQQKRIEAMEAEQITIMQEQEKTNQQYLEETKKRDRRIAELEEYAETLYARLYPSKDSQ
jgi:hypothetical protein